MAKAKKFQPLAVLNQKLKGLDVFEPNDTPPPAPLNPSTASSHATPEPPRIDADEAVTRAHWQRPGPYDACSEPSCGKRLGGTSGSVNCRKCGKLFCEDHTMYQMKLSRSAHHEPVRGFWCRVCETCYKSREGYNDHNGEHGIAVYLACAYCDRLRAGITLMDLHQYGEVRLTKQYWKSVAWKSV